MIKSIRVISRAVEVMRLLDEEPGQSLASLTARTGLPKASLARVLLTLEQEGLVWRTMADGFYRNRVRVMQLSPRYLEHFRIADVAGPVLRDLRARLVWPSDLSVRSGWHMEQVESSRRLSGLALVREEVGFRADMLMSAAGRAYLAWCDEAECREIVEHLRLHPEDQINPQRVAWASVQRMLDEVRTRGYATRDPRYGGSGHPKRDADDGLNAAAVPILLEPGKVAGCVNIVWMRRFDLGREVDRVYVPALRAAAARIAERLLESSQAR